MAFGDIRSIEVIHACQGEVDNDTEADARFCPFCGEVLVAPATCPRTFLVDGRRQA